LLRYGEKIIALVALVIANPAARPTVGRERGSQPCPEMVGPERRCTIAMAREMKKIKRK
jgi:hypothetical protein